MPQSALRPCAYPGCDELVRSGQCDQHITGQLQRHPERQRLYDRHWQKRRVIQLTIQPWCEDCLAVVIYEPATEPHHVERHNGNREKFINGELISLCKSCHSRRTSREQGGRDN